VFNCAHPCALEVSPLEAGLPVISVGCFPCDPGGVTCITLHFFNQFFYDMFTSDTVNGQKRDLFARPDFRGDAKVPGAGQKPWLSSDRGTPVKIRQVA